MDTNPTASVEVKDRDSMEIRRLRSERKKSKAERKEAARKRAFSERLQVRGPDPDIPPKSLVRESKNPPSNGMSPTGNWYCQTEHCEHHDHTSPVTKRMITESRLPPRCPACRATLVMAAANGLPTWYDADTMRRSKRLFG